jgi:uncharacterized protein (DUF1015 family)
MSLQNSAHIYGPFAALRPAAEHAAEVAAPPYDVMTTDEALDLATGKPWSFLHVSRPEIDMPRELMCMIRRYMPKARKICAA